MDHREDGERVEQEFRIVELQGKVKELAEGEIESWESPDCPPELREQFWAYVLDCEKAPDTTLQKKFAEQGVELPPAESLSDQELNVKLWESITRLSEMRSFLFSTDHLSDRELYCKLRNEIFQQEYPDLALSAGMNQHIDLLGSGCEDDVNRWLTYYADEETRREWLVQFPDYQLPAHEDPPYDRDRLLPRPEDGTRLPPEIELN